MYQYVRFSQGLHYCPLIGYYVFRETMETTINPAKATAEMMTLMAVVYRSWSRRWAMSAWAMEGYSER